MWPTMCRRWTLCGGADAGVVESAAAECRGRWIAHGHPLGATGGVLMTKLVDILEKKGGRYGLQSMCIGYGMATATIIEVVN